MSQYFFFSGAQMNLEINTIYFYPIREMTGKSEEKVEVDVGATVEVLLDILSKKYGEEFERLVYSGVKQKGLRIIFLLDEENVQNLEGLKTKLRDGCTVTMLPPIAGG
jgi:MoaD family protein